MTDEPTLEQEIEQAVEESVAEDAPKEPEGDGGTPEKAESFQSEGSTEEVLVPAEDEDTTPEDTQQEAQEDTQSDAQRVAAAGDIPEGSNEEGTPEEKPAEISPATLASAVGSGLTLDQARSFKSEEALSQFNARVQYERRQAAEQQWSQHAQQEQRNEQAPGDPFADFPKLDPEEYDQGVIDVVDRLTGIARQQQEEIQEFRGQQEQQATQVAQAGQQEVESWFDTEVAGLGENFKEKLGDGSYRSLSPGSPQAAVRDEIADQMSIMIAGYQHHGMPVPARSDIFETAAKSVLADRYTELANEELTGKLKSQQSQHIQRVSKSKLKRQLTSEEEDEQLGAEIDSKFS